MTNADKIAMASRMRIAAAELLAPQSDDEVRYEARPPRWQGPGLPTRREMRALLAADTLRAADMLAGARS